MDKIDLKSFSGFTPGPWNVLRIRMGRGQEDIFRVWRGDPGFAVVATCQSVEGNAHLIAAAPKILARALELESREERLLALLREARDDLAAGIETAGDLEAEHSKAARALVDRIDAEIGA